MKKRCEMPRRIVTAVFVVAGAMLAVNGWGQTTESASSAAEPTESDFSASTRDTPEIGADGAGHAQNSAIEQRRAFRDARRQATLELISSANRDAPRAEVGPFLRPARLQSAKERANQTVPQEKVVPPAATEARQQQATPAPAQEEPVPAAALADIIISFGPDPGHTQGSRNANHPEPQSRYSAVREGEVSLEARVEGRDAKGLPVAISAAWNPADPATVDVSPGEGSAVKITVRGSGQSNLTVAGPGFTKDLWISAIAKEGKAIHVDISQ